MEKWVIVNPAAGRGKVGRLSGAILKAARQEGAKAFLTEGPGHATELAQRAPEGARVVAVAAWRCYRKAARPARSLAAATASSRKPTPTPTFARP